jgi:monoamine oxidase
MSLAEALDPLAADPWLASIEMFEATLIAAADARELSLRDWRVNELDGHNLNVSGGLGAFVARRLAVAARLDTPVSRISWGDGVAVETPSGVLRAAAAIVTVSTGVLRAEAIRFDPPLPGSHLAALDGLPMGLLDKVALVALDGGRAGIAPSRGLTNRLSRRHVPAMSFLAWPYGAAYVTGFTGGSTAWALRDKAARFAFARDQLAAALGAETAARLRPVLATDWGGDPAFRGAYAYAGVGHAGARAALGEALADGRLVFAGEAVAGDGLAGTVGGAWLSGVAAADTVLAALPG